MRIRHLTAILATAILALSSTSTAHAATAPTNTLKQITAFTITNTLVSGNEITVNTTTNTITATYGTDVVATYTYGTRISDTAAKNQVTKIRTACRNLDAFAYKWESTGYPVTANTKTNQLEARNKSKKVIARISYNFGVTDAQATELAGHYPD